MKKNKRKLKRRTNAKRKKTTVQSFSKSDAWDVIVVVILLTIIVYFSTYVRNNHFAVVAWPAIEFVNINGVIDAVDHKAFMKLFVVTSQMVFCT
ncbi:MAG: hypothetical protein P8X88_01715 [Gammaproteobacteria bacterium]